ncbi:MAG: hypothetical protein OQK12_10385 [Motiliproteus sp.]|nr:hypothetical protein [Motiliproteus sp.]MCW9052821.1 hypothetical protein [Motiliproteus sp.]
MRILPLLLLSLISFQTFAESMTVTVKPSKGFTGTAFFNFHESGSVSLMYYHSPIKAKESTLSMDPDVRKKTLEQAQTILSDYLSRESYLDLEESKLAIGISQTKEGVTKSISANRLTAPAKALVDSLLPLIPKK